MLLLRFLEAAYEHTASRNGRGRTSAALCAKVTTSIESGRAVRAGARSMLHSTDAATGAQPQVGSGCDDARTLDSGPKTAMTQTVETSKASPFVQPVDEIQCSEDAPDCNTPTSDARSTVRRLLRLLDEDDFTAISGDYRTWLKASSDGCDESESACGGPTYGNIGPNHQGSSEYNRLAQLHKEVESRDQYTALQTDAKLQARFLHVLQTMEMHYERYTKLVDEWLSCSSHGSFEELARAHARLSVAARFRLSAEGPRAQLVLQPNPFIPAVDAQSKSYLAKTLATFTAKLESGELFRGCQMISTELGVEWRAGKLKKEQRIIEKALLRANRFDEIRDYARGCFIINELADMARLLHRIEGGDEYTVVRVKNRFAEDYDPLESSGYRDYQLLARLSDGYMVEIQIIPRKMYEVKSELGCANATGETLLTGHDAYKEYRAIREAKLRRHGQSETSMERAFRASQATIE